MNRRCPNCGSTEFVQHRDVKAQIVEHGRFTLDESSGWTWDRTAMAIVGSFEEEYTIAIRIYCDKCNMELDPPVVIGA